MNIINIHDVYGRTVLILATASSLPVTSRNLLINKYLKGPAYGQTGRGCFVK